MNSKNNKGIIHLLPLLLVAGIAVLGFSLYKSSVQGGFTSSVLSNRSGFEGMEGRDGDTPGRPELESDAPEEEVEDSEDVERVDGRNETRNTRGEENGDINREQKEIRTETKLQLRENKLEFETESPGDGQKIQVHVENRNNFPLSIDELTNELLVTTPKGTKAVTVLPDVAVENILKNDKLSEISVVDLLSGDSGEVEYRVSGFEHKKLFGIFDVKISQDYNVSSVTGEETPARQNLLNRFLSAFSF